MDLKTFSKKLRHAADVLDDLLETTGTPAVARKIQRNMDRAVRGAITRRIQKLRKPRSAAVRRRMKMAQQLRRKKEANGG